MRTKQTKRANEVSISNLPRTLHRTPTSKQFRIHSYSIYFRKIEIHQDMQICISGINDGSQFNKIQQFRSSFMREDA